MLNSEIVGLCQRGWGRGEFGSKAGGSEIPGQATQGGQEGTVPSGKALRECMGFLVLCGQGYPHGP